MSQIIEAYFLLVLAGISWGLTPLFVKMAQLSLIQTSIGRAFLTATFLGIALFFMSKDKGDKKSFRLELFVGTFAALSTGCFAAACIFTDPERLNPLYYTYPAISLCVDIWLGKKARREEIAVILLGMIGFCLLSFHAWQSKPLGIGEAFAILSSVTWVIYNRLRKRFLSSVVQGLRALVYGQISIFVVGCIFLVQGSELLETNLYSWSWILILGISSSLPLFAWNWATRDVKTKVNALEKDITLVSVHRAGAIVQMEAIVGVIAVCYFLNKPLDISSMIGGSIILVSAWLAIYCDWLEKSATNLPKK